MRSWEKWNIKREKQNKHRPETLELVINHRGPICLSSRVSLTQTVDLDNIYEAASPHTQVKKLSTSEKDNFNASYRF